MPVMPLRIKMMAMRCQPASFSRSRRMVIWKTTDTKQCTTLGRGAHQASAVPPRLCLRLPARHCRGSGVWRLVAAARWPGSPPPGVWGAGAGRHHRGLAGRGGQRGAFYPAWRNRDSQSL